jgi:hypothetical protein
MSPGAHTPGRLVRWFFDFQVSFNPATNRREIAVRTRIAGGF